MSMTVDHSFHARLARIQNDPGASAVPTPGDITNGGAMSHASYKRVLATQEKKPLLNTLLLGSIALAIVSLLSFVATLLVADIVFPLAETSWTLKSWFMAVLAAGVLATLVCANALAISPPLATPQAVLWVVIAEMITYEAIFRLPAEASLVLNEKIVMAIVSLTEAGSSPASLSLTGLF
ncbi:hypothetical protein [Primorskyibacter sp. S187A]|uniref:hypothetical protein n=1 Tax=Primorskyibacter sp. S187A TaxID=3415130 RepID=UPI003C7CD047